jgi:demethylmenaquinone methyltransferase/2-methoxy-6-polyprenyl-1,4-benzoquinol methylase
MMVYYWETMDAVVPAETIVAAMKSAGLVDVRRHVVGGIFSEYTAQRRAE